MSFNSLLLSYSHFSDFPQILARLISFLFLKRMDLASMLWRSIKVW